jgi:formylmethanofuran dehydrogenase subunit E
LIRINREQVFFRGGVLSNAVRIYVDSASLAAILYWYVSSTNAKVQQFAGETKDENMRYRKQRVLSYADAVRFHGHDGPFLAVGYRLGRFLTKALEPKGIMGLQIRVRTKIKKPYTCLIDGLQCSTFATIGKGNIAVVGNNKKNISVHVQCGRKTARFAMSTFAWDICLRAEDLEKAARKILRTPTHELWEQQK